MTRPASSTRIAGLLLGALALLATAPCFGQDSLKGAPRWLSSFDDAKAEARKEKRRLLAFFHGSDWCPPCMRMQREVFDTPEFAAYAEKNLVLLDVDFPQKKELPKGQLKANFALKARFNVGDQEPFQGLPTILLFNEFGFTVLQEKGYFGGGVRPFLEKLERLKVL